VFLKVSELVCVANKDQRDKPRENALLGRALRADPVPLGLLYGEFHTKGWAQIMR